MYCQKCGHQNPDEAQFCGKCGAPMAQQAAPAPPPAGPAPTASRTGGGSVSSGLKVGIVVGSLIIPLLGIVMGAIYLADANPKKKAAGRLWLLVGIGAFLFYCILSLLAAMAGGW